MFFHENRGSEGLISSGPSILTMGLFLLDWKERIIWHRQSENRGIRQTDWKKNKKESFLS